MTTPQSIRPLVLVADDDEDILALVTFSLRRDGYEVVQARDGAEALELARERRPAALVLDVMMPKASGFDVTRALRAEGNDVPILLLTASVQER
ncbi:MAG TPA: response regulator, partial [Gaiellaceae bacterium]|nr:response regulator [Gaiellaceae bacterium]